MKIKKKVNKFANELAEVLGDNATLESGLQAYVMSYAMVQLLVEDKGPNAGLNEVFEMLQIACAEQGYNIKFTAPTVH